MRSLARELLIPEYGVSPLENISHIRMPYDQTSQSDVYLPKLSASGAVHLTGICFMPSETIWMQNHFDEMLWDRIVMRLNTYVFFFFAWHAKVWYFDAMLEIHKTISSCEIAMYTVFRLQISHA